MGVSSEVMPPIDTGKQLVLNFKAVDAEVPAGPGGSTPLIPAWLMVRKAGAVAAPAVRKVGVPAASLCCNMNNKLHRGHQCQPKPPEYRLHLGCLTCQVFACTSGLMLPSTMLHDVNHAHESSKPLRRRSCIASLAFETRSWTDSRAHALS